jgi:hypothetical protein
MGNNNPRCRYHHRMTIGSCCCRVYYPRLVGRREITSPEQDRRCCQRKKYYDFFHGFISIIEQVRSPYFQRNLSGEGLDSILIPRSRLVSTHRFVNGLTFRLLTGRLADRFTPFLFLHVHFHLYRRGTLIALFVGTLLMMIRSNIAATKDDCRDCQGKEGAEFFHDFFYLFLGDGRK